MSYKTRAKLGGMFEHFQKSMRHYIRRRYLRKSMAHYMSNKKVLTKEQLRQAKEYWGKYTKHFSPIWHEFYTQKNGFFDVRYIPEDLMFTEIEEYLNDWDSAHGIDNKCNYSMYFPDVKMPKTLFRKMRGIYHGENYEVMSKEQAIQNCIEEGNLILKCAVESGRGGGVYFWNKEKSDEATLRQMIDELPSEAIAQAIIVQHPEIDRLHHDSINCIRVVTMIRPEGVEYICAYFRMGQGGNRIDYLGGCSCTIQPDGRLNPHGCDNMTCDLVDEHACGQKFSEYRIPHFEKIKQTAMRLHAKLGDFRIASWDFSVSPEGEPIFIEVNLKYGGTKYHQLGKGPMFGEKTDEILNEVYGKK